MRFSERIGKKAIKSVIQIESIDQQLEIRLWNVILNNFFSQFSKSTYNSTTSEHYEVCKFIWIEYFNKRTDHFAGSKDFLENLMYWYFNNSEWFEKYDFIEFLSYLGSSYNLDFDKECNSALKRELSGYRILDHIIVPITEQEELDSIEEAITNSDRYKSVSTHLSCSLEFLSDRDSPDYRNSIKESISAVESLCKIVTGDDKATLGKALAVIEKKYNIHGSLKTAFNAIYGYASDTGGIRHSMLEDDIEITFEDAKFMLVSCTAFINYLKAKIELQ
ncbi:AbiJ-NTD4 domain-containing protein [Rubrolithibacter danxiaensis]|uniref:AbiJ-NTD4 domain-containing protein n=1 Tax=Rubrolithibacter danxiaensis TaxID=3390805 RepID=UPI003BF86B9F